MKGQPKPMDEKRTLTEWREMEAGFEFDRFVAEKLGWKIEQLQHPDYLMKSHERYRILKPNGNFDEFDYYSDIDPWEGVRVFDLIPEFSTDLNAAFTLFSTELGLEWNLFSEWGDEWVTCELGHWNEPGHPDELEQATEKTPALAICKAFLAWQERPDHPAPEYPKEGKD